MNEIVTVKFAKLKENAIIPSRDEGNIGYDIYACFPEKAVAIAPHTTKLIPTGLCSIIPKGYAMLLWDRGSTGTKCMPTACGVIDSNFRGEWFVALHNDSNNPIIIVKKDVTDNELQELFPIEMSNKDTLKYPYEKAITQAILTYDIPSKVETITVEEVKTDKTNRGSGVIGSTGK